MKQAVFLLLGICLSLQTTTAQAVYFSKQFSIFPNLPSVGIRITTMPEGYAFTSLEGYYLDPKGSGFYITDKQGNLLQKRLVLPHNYLITGLQYHPEDSTFHFWGDIFVGAGKNLYHPFLAKTNWWGDTIQVTRFNYPAFNFCRNALQLPDKGYAMLISTSTPDSSIIGLIRVDSTGKERWHKAFRTGFYHYNNYGLFLKNDSTLLVGYDAFYKTIDSTLPPTDGYGIMEVTLEGTLKRDTAYYAHSILDSYTGWLSKIGNGRYAFVYRPPFLPNGNLQWIACIDEHYQLLWQKHPISTASATYTPAFTVNNKGNIVTGGQTIGWGGFHPFISEMDPNGEIIWERIAQSPIKGLSFLNSSVFEAIRQTDDGGYIVTGGFDTNDNAPKTWLLKIDSLGCLEPGCETGVSVTLGTDVQETSPPTPALRIGPNPGNAHINVALLRGAGYLCVFDLHGQPLMPRFYVEDKVLTLYTQTWPSGTYLIRFASKDGAIAYTERFVIAHSE